MISAFPVWKKALLAGMILIVALLALYKLHPTFFLPQLEPITVSQVIHKESPALRFDRVLLGHLEEFRHNRAFHHVFSAGVKLSDISHLWVDRCEVSQGNFQSFTHWEKVFQPGSTIHAPGQPSGWNYKSNTSDHAISGKLTAPANGVAYYDAYAYCKSVNGRLPYKNEWLAVAGGAEKRLYPWGNQFTSLPWSYLERRLNASQRCATRPQLATPEGVHDMGANVSEWGQNRDNPLKPLILGGNAYDQPYEIYSLNGLYRYAPVRYRSPYVGFRCVYDKKPPTTTPWRKPLEITEFPAGKYNTGIPDGTKVVNLILKLPPERLATVANITGMAGDKKKRTVSFMTHEVTRNQYRNFLLDPFVQFGMHANENEPLDLSYVPSDWAQQMNNPELAVVGVDWWSASAYAAWSGGRLPTSTEWAIAASNHGTTLYPWGNEFQSTIALTGEAGLNLPANPGSWPGDKTSNGIYDLGGNVSEWTKSAWPGTVVPTAIARGGNFLLPGIKTAGIHFANELPLGHRSPAVGFRVVFDGRKYLNIF